MGELAQLGAVGIHGEDLRPPSALCGKNDALAIGGEAGFLIAIRAVGEDGRLEVDEVGHGNAKAVVLSARVGEHGSLVDGS